MEQRIDRSYLSEMIYELYNILTEGNHENDMMRVCALAEEESAADHWLMTKDLDYGSRIFLFAATAFALRCMNNNSYKCAIFVRSAAEALLQRENDVKTRGAA